MISASSATRQARLTEAPALPSLLLDLPRDVIPNIFTRLPGSDLLRLAQVSKEMPMDDKKKMLTEWVSRELKEITSLHDEERWTRFVDLAANCADMIDSADWDSFLAASESRHPGYAMLFGLALLSHAKAGNSDTLERLASTFTDDLGTYARAALLALSTGADGEPWMGKMAGAVIAMRWLQLVDQDTESSDRAAVDKALREMALLFSYLPLAHQVDVIPLLECCANDTEDASRVFAEISKLHMHKLARHVFRPVPDFCIADAGRSYLANLVNMHKPEYACDDMRVAKDLMRQILAESVSNGMNVGPWREQVPELAVCLFLALQASPETNAMDQPLGTRLVEQGFITKEEYEAFSGYVMQGSDSAFGKVAQWLALNYNKEQEVLLPCTIG